MTFDTIQRYGFIIPFADFLNDKSEAHLQFSLDTCVHDMEDSYQKSLRNNLAFSNFEYLALRKKFFLDTEPNEDENRNEWDELSIRLSDIIEYHYIFTEVLRGFFFDDMGRPNDEAADYAGIGFITNDPESSTVTSRLAAGVKGNVFIYIDRTLRFASNKHDSLEPTEEEREAIARFIKDFGLDITPSWTAMELSI